MSELIGCLISLTVSIVIAALIFISRLAFAMGSRLFKLIYANKRASFVVILALFI